MVTDTVKKFGGLDILCNNAGYFRQFQAAARYKDHTSTICAHILNSPRAALVGASEISLGAFIGIPAVVTACIGWVNATQYIEAPKR